MPSNPVGIDGHQWTLRSAAAARLPYRAMCECGWTSTAGQRTEVLLELKGHLEDALSDHPPRSRQDADSQPITTVPSSLDDSPGAHEQGGDHDDL